MILNSRLGELQVGDQAEILSMESREGLEGFQRRLLEIGFLVGERIEVLGEAPFSRDPMSVRIKDATYALRREEANSILVKKIHE